jgi:DNA primase
LKSSAAFIAEELSVRVASLPAGEDPDSLVRDHGAEALRSRVASAVSALDFLINVMAQKEDHGNEAGLMRTARAVQALIAQAPGAVQRDRMVQHAAERLGISPAALRRDLARKKERPAPSVAPEAPVVPVKHPDEEAALVQMLFLHPAEVLPVVADHLPPGHLTDPDCRLLMELMLEDPSALMDSIPEDRPEAQRLAFRIQMEEMRLRGDVPPAKAAQDIVMALWRQVLTRRRRELQVAGRAAEATEITHQLYHLKQGWEHAVGFLVV